ncbi:MAG: hypothetical protein HC888_00565 [Candidatus Competibacteraceae bacterium]|nr:hypothetical protein [Candidatus Competibacteraceae bacterium]
MIKVKREDLKSVVEKMRKFERGGSIDFYVEKDSLTASADNSQVYITCVVPCHGDTASFDGIQIPSKLLRDYIQESDQEFLWLKAVSGARSLQVVIENEKSRHSFPVCKSASRKTHPIANDGAIIMATTSDDLADAVGNASLFSNRSDFQLDRIGASGPMFFVTENNGKKFLKVIGTTSTNGVCTVIPIETAQTEAYLGMLAGPCVDIFHEMASTGSRLIHFNDTLATIFGVGTFVTAAQAHSNLSDMIGRVIASRSKADCKWEVDYGLFNSIAIATVIPSDFLGDRNTEVYWGIAEEKSVIISKGNSGSSVVFQQVQSLTGKKELVFDAQKFLICKKLFLSKSPIKMSVAGHILFCQQGSTLYYQCLKGDSRGEKYKEVSEE